MKLKLVTFLLVITTLLFGITAGVLYTLIDSYEKTICDRELTINSYKRVIDAMGRSNTISLDQLKTELTIDFYLDEKSYNDYSNEYYFVIHPKNEEVNRNENIDFMGLQLVFDYQQKLKTIYLYKP
ncbi:hypothetical protein [Maribacter flavus]|uniref:Uncharacterized protein n=1 Tax=Maribacter flavus TaxID=1658664 RepID=A0A5B2TXV8_9FLAO|nr:hypothetical protein [Maribacter flavus]KAA2218818.1 hypothetical protein F0361_04110 [Maribacter flavus]